MRNNFFKILLCYEDFINNQERVKKVQKQIGKLKEKK